MVSPTSSRARSDLGRSELYAAEIAAFGGTSFDEVVPFEHLERLAGSLTAAPWWPHGDVEMVPTLSDARSSSTSWRPGQQVVVRIAANQHTPITLAHEFAHVLAGVDCGHGPNFRRAYLDIVDELFGPAQARWLSEALSAHRLAVGDRSWPEPSSARRSTGLAGAVCSDDPIAI